LPSIQYWPSNFGEFSSPYVFFSLPSYCGHLTVDDNKALARQETPTIQQLGGFTCYFLGTPRKSTCSYIP
jgi:hypothetical protein